MGKASVALDLDVPVSEAEALWYDTSRWAAFIDGFHHIVRVDEGWPKQGEVVWQSVPDGRGRVVERVAHYEVRSGQTVEVDDATILGTQTVTFAPKGDGSTIALRIEWKRKDGGFTAPLVDALFVKRAFSDALRRTLSRFRRELRADRELSA